MQWHYTDELPRPKFGETQDSTEPPMIATGGHFVAAHEVIISYLHHGFW